MYLLFHNKIVPSEAFSWTRICKHYDRKRLEYRAPIRGVGNMHGKIGTGRSADRICSMESWHLALRGLVLYWELHVTVLKRLFPLSIWETDVVPSSLLLLP